MVKYGHGHRSKFSVFMSHRVCGKEIAKQKERLAVSHRVKAKTFMNIDDDKLVLQLKEINGSRKTQTQIKLQVHCT